MKKEELMLKTEEITIVNNKTLKLYDPKGLGIINPGDTITLNNYFYPISNKLPLCYPYSCGEINVWITMKDILENFELVK